MGVKHKAHKTTLDRGYASEWNDDHQFDPSDEFMMYDCLIFERFASNWDDTQKSGAGAVGVTCEGADGSGHVFASLASGGGAGDYISIRAELNAAASNITSPVDLPIMTTSVYLATIDNVDTPVEIGLFEFDTVPFTANQAGAYFRIKNNSLYAVTGTGAAETEELLGTLASFETDYLVLRVEVLSASIKFYVNDMISYKVDIANNRPVKNLTIKLACVKTTAGANILKFDSIALQRLRKN